MTVIKTHATTLRGNTGEKAFWGKGIGAAAPGMLVDFAFCAEHVDELYCFVADYNVRSQRMLLKLGFSPAGKMMQAACGQRKSILVASRGMTMTIAATPNRQTSLIRRVGAHYPYADAPQQKRTRKAL